MADQSPPAPIGDGSELDLSAHALGARALAVKNARIKAEQDHALLANRLKRLRAEQERVAKRVAETRKRTEHIKQLRERNVHHVQEREEAILFLRVERDLQRQALRRVREARERNVANARAKLHGAKLEESATRKAARRAHEEVVRKERAEAEEAAAQRRAAVRDEERRAIERRRAGKEERLASLRIAAEEKRRTILQHQEEHAAKVAAMEAEELRCAPSGPMAGAPATDWHGAPPAIAARPSG